MEGADDADSSRYDASGSFNRHRRRRRGHRIHDGHAAVRTVAAVPDRRSAQAAQRTAESECAHAEGSRRQAGSLWNMATGDNEDLPPEGCFDMLAGEQFFNIGWGLK